MNIIDEAAVEPMCIHLGGWVCKDLSVCVCGCTINLIIYVVWDWDSVDAPSVTINEIQFQIAKSHFLSLSFVAPHY